MLLYYSPGACSFAVHVVLKELALPHELRLVQTGRDEHERPSYRARNPVGRVPLLEEDGRRMTETTALLRFLARRVPERALYPSDPELAVRCDEILSQIASIAHPAFRMAIRPDREARGIEDADLDTVQAIGRRIFRDILGHVESKLPNEGFAIGTLSIVDPYLLSVWMWARYGHFDFAVWPKLTRIARAVRARPTTQAALVAEGLVDAEGRSTPPDRV